MSKKRGLQSDKTEIEAELEVKEISSRIEEKMESSDPIADLIAVNPELEDEFPEGFVFFAANIRWFGSYVVENYLTTTGKRYVIHREGTKVDIMDMEALREITTTVYCPRDKRTYTIHPGGVTSI